MQVEVVGQWIYIYSGREVVDSSKPQENDPFAEVHVFRKKDIVGFRVDHQQQFFTFVVKGHPYPLTVEFGQRPNPRVNAFTNTLNTLLPVLEEVGIPRNMILDMNRRSELIAKVRTREEDADSYGPEMGLP